MYPYHIPTLYIRRTKHNNPCHIPTVYIVNVLYTMGNICFPQYIFYILWGTCWSRGLHWIDPYHIPTMFPITVLYTMGNIRFTPTLVPHCIYPQRIDIICCGYIPWVTFPIYYGEHILWGNPVYTMGKIVFADVH